MRTFVTVLFILQMVNVIFEVHFLAQEAKPGAVRMDQFHRRIVRIAMSLVIAGWALVLLTE